jgi:hypothetical protein
MLSSIAEPAILVSATMASIQLLIQIDNTWMPALSIPVIIFPSSGCTFWVMQFTDASVTYTHPGGCPVNYQLAVHAGTHYFFISEVVLLQLKNCFFRKLI